MMAQQQQQQQQQHQSKDEQHQLYHQQHQHQKKNHGIIIVAYIVLVLLSTALAMLVLQQPETAATTPLAVTPAATKPAGARTSTNNRDAVAAVAIREGKNRKFREEEGSSTTTVSSFVGPCAINLYGLPRSFASLVLPSLLRNVVAPNLRYGCDYFVHYHDLREERSGRSGRGGSVRPDEILLLKRAVESLIHEHHDIIPMPTVAFIKDTEEQFWERYGGLYETILPQTTNNNPADIGNNKPPLLYHLPSNDTIANVLKMWHSQQSAWNLMERVGRSKQLTQKRTPAATSNETTTRIKHSNHSDHGDHNDYYQRVAMLRSDVVYVTPIDIYQTPPQPQRPAASLSQERTKKGNNNKRGGVARGPSPVVIPSFAKYPVNDRMILGPTAAVRIWASQKFSRLDGYLRGLKTPLHSERYLQRSIFPAIRAEGYRIVEDDSLCFVRARADESIWFSDCDDRRRRRGGRGAGRGLLNYEEGGESSSSSPSPPIMATEHNQRMIEQMIRRSCELSLAKTKGRRLIELNCAKR